MSHRLEKILSNWQRLCFLAASCLLMTIAASCSSGKILKPRLQPSPNLASLDLQIEPASQPGGYILSGNADLPDGSKITVIAMRYLRLKQTSAKTQQSQTTYSILDYDVVDIDGKRWQTQLALWRVAANGQFQEAWQIHQPELELAVEPEDQVVFLTTLASIDDFRASEQQLARRELEFASRFVRTTEAGQPYLQIGEAMPVDLPQEKTHPVAISPEDINGGWGNRFLELPDPPNTRQLEFPDQRQTNAPILQGEVLY